jgi:copper chaperone
MTKVTLNVPDISCEHCEHAINSALTPVQGVRSVQVDIPRHLVQLEYDESAVTLDQVKGILAEEEYPVESVV